MQYAVFRTGVGSWETEGDGWFFEDDEVVVSDGAVYSCYLASGFGKHSFAARLFSAWWNGLHSQQDTHKSCKTNSY